MYGALWRVLPGPVWLRIIILVVLFTWVFPYVDSFIVDQNVTVGDE
jgi:hypothetical protein